jgi:integrase
LPELAEWGRQHPQAQKINPGTVNKLLGGVQAIAIWARDKGGMVPDDVQWADPFSRMRLEVDDSDRAPFEPDELQAVFNSPVFTKGERPKGGKGEAAFWLPLLGLFTGARRGELASLRPTDIAHDPAIDAVSIYFTAAGSDRLLGLRCRRGAD